MITDRRQQKGAALLIVLLLAATLSFVAMSAMQRTALAAARASNVSARSEGLWRALAVETLALAAAEQFASAENPTMSLDDEWAREPIELPLEDGAARVFFTDATACFNINSLAVAYGDASGDAVIAEFVRLAGFLDISDYEAAAIAEAIGDWIDQDTNRRPQGGEDEYYTALPSPYRTGNQPMTSVTELRSVKGVSREIYGSLKPYVCAQDSTEPSTINVNMLAERHAPLLAAILRPEATIQTARDIIASRPPGGYQSVEAFMTSPLVAALKTEQSGRFSVTSRYLIARAEIVYDTALIEMTSTIEASQQGARVIARRIGAEE
ncbi:type II secretion system minor pseudopilin GspK [Hyphococcus sp.]|uniref:type II secretion system minor pseudopilin GspK n=1 Tax=Hyphococcus sp. TaxID=2038636 RepID=UPI00208CF4C7|nr:MAG: type II secretion system protein K [Marinicaulis sp.]